MLLTILFCFLKSIFFVDFVSGLGHWLQDRYGTEEMTWIKDSIVIPNKEHHQSPRKFLSHSYWYRNNVMIITGIFLAFMFAINGIHPFTNFCSMILLSNINEIHAYAHRKKSETPKIVLWCQNIGLLQSKKHHNLHHSSPFEVRYCILTDWLNPILDKIKFFRFLEWIIFKVFKAKPNVS